MTASLLFALARQRGLPHPATRFALEVAAVARVGTLMTDATCAAFEGAVATGRAVKYTSETSAKLK